MLTENETTTVAAPEAPEVTQEPETVTRGVVFDCTKLNVRKAPRADAPVLCTIRCGTEVTVSNVNAPGKFYKVCTASGVEGFCMKQYIKI